MSCSVNYSKKAIIFITGASRGIGKSIAVELSKHINQNSIFVLFARSEQGLQETKAQINRVNKSLTVQTQVIDLAKPNFEHYNTIFKGVLSNLDTSGIEFGLFFHNAGSVGVLKQTTDLTDLQEWHDYYNLNLFSVALLNSLFMKYVCSIAPKLVVINITSLCGRSPFVNMAMYGSAKAARDMFFKVLTVEEPNVVVLNYSPGPVETDMFSDICKNAQSDNVRKQFKETKEKSILKADQTVCKMISILEKGDFKSGDVIDYFDV